MSSDIDFAKLLPEVALKLWGTPSQTKTHEMRWGNKGGRRVDLRRSLFSDATSEHATINSGGTLKLIERETGLTGKDATDWLHRNGFIDAAQAEPRPRDGSPAKSKSKASSAPAPEDRGAPPPEEPSGYPEVEPPFTPDDPAEATRPAEKPKPVKTPMQVVASYEYTDGQGALLYVVDRVEWTEDGKRHKTFWQKRPAPDEPGVWVLGISEGEFMRAGPGKDWRKFDAEKFDKWRMKERREFPAVSHGLYRLEELREAMHAREVVFLPEGEKKVEALRRLGVPASTNSGGAKNWRPEFAEAFRNADVVVPLDNDKVGRERGEMIAKDLHGIARRVRLLDFAAFEDPGRPLPSKYDVADYLAAGGDAESLFGLVERLPAWEPPRYASKFGALAWTDLDAPGPEHEWLIKNFLTRGERSLLAGASGSGKTFLATTLALSICRGVDFFGRRVVPGGVVYQAGEGGKGVKKRLRAYRQWHGLDPADPLPFVLLPAPIDLYADEDQTNAFIGECKHWASTFKVPLELVVIDTLSAATPGADENSSKDIGPVLARCARIADALQCHVMLVHHMNADGLKPRGHTSISANLDSVIIVRKLENMHDQNGRMIREANTTKQKDEEDGVKLRFILHKVELGRDVDDDPITSCVVATPDDDSNSAVEPGAEEKGERIGTNAEILLRAVYAAIEKQGERPSDDLRLAGHVKVANWKYVVEEFSRTWFGDDEDAATSPEDGVPEEDRQAARRRRIAREMKAQGSKLLARGFIGRAANVIWLTGKRVAGFRPHQNAERRPKEKPPELPLDSMADRLSNADVLDFMGGGGFAD